MSEVRRLRLGASVLVSLLLGACGGGGGGSSSTPAPPPPAPPPPIPVLNAKASASQVYVGEFVQFSAGDAMPGVSYSWRFSDNTSASGASIERRVTAEGPLSATVEAENSAGVKVQASLNLSASKAPEITQTPANRWAKGCNGLHCGAETESRKAAAGVGVWRYRNDGSANASVDIDLDGLKAGQAVTLIFTNGAATAAPQAPVAGAMAAALNTLRHISSAAQSMDTAHDHRDTNGAAADAAHARQMRLLALQAQEDAATPPVQVSATEQAETRRRALAVSATQIGSTRVWNDLFDDVARPLARTATVTGICTAPSGRRVVFWLDQELVSNNTASASDVSPLQNAFCGERGGYALVTAMLGDVWGSATTANRPWLIPEVNGSLQDVNVVLLGKLGEKDDLAGYFYSLNNSKRSRGSRYANSNEALAFFINGTKFVRSKDFYTSTLVHELTHMVNYHQRTLLRSTSHDSWLEEVSAMLSEDLLAQSVTPGYNKIIESRMPGYLRTEGAQSLLAWSAADEANNYEMGGSLAAFINRRYGQQIARRLISDCRVIESSYACLDRLLREAGSAGLADEWERTGASVFGGMPQRHAPLGYGFPARQDGDLLLLGTDTAALASRRKASNLATLTEFKSTSHLHIDDEVPAGATRYLRRGVVLPPGTALTVVVR